MFLWLALACMEYDIYPQVEEPGIYIEPSTPIDLLIVLDTSCSMADDWGTINYGITTIPQQMADAELDGKIAMISADPAAGLFYEVEALDGWGMAIVMDNVMDMGGYYEKPFDASIVAALEHSNFFRDDAIPILLHVSDEEEQSEIRIESYWRFWGPEAHHVCIAGINQQRTETCTAEYGSRFIDACDIVLDVCANDAWTLFEQEE